MMVHTPRSYRPMLTTMNVVPKAGEKADKNPGNVAGGLKASVPSSALLHNISCSELTR